MSVPTPIELRALLITLVAGVTETRTTRWNPKIGEGKILPLALHPQCNWRIAVEGSDEDREVLDAAVELLRREHPYVTG